jgi:hypothetical protein
MNCIRSRIEDVFLNELNQSDEKKWKRKIHARMFGLMNEKKMSFIRSVRSFIVDLDYREIDDFFFLLTAVDI